MRGGRGRNQIIRRPESQVLYNTLNTIWWETNFLQGPEEPCLLPKRKLNINYTNNDVSGNLFKTMPIHNTERWFACFCQHIPKSNRFPFAIAPKVMRALFANCMLFLPNFTEFAGGAPLPFGNLLKELK